MLSCEQHFDDRSSGKGTVYPRPKRSETNGERYISVHSIFCDDGAVREAFAEHARGIVCATNPINQESMACVRSAKRRDVRNVRTTVNVVPLLP